MSIKTLILAAGKGTRMRSKLPKVLHQIANRTLLGHVYDTSKQLNKNEIIVIYGHGGEQVKEHLGNLDAKWVEQKEQLGTGHAVLQADALLNKEDTVLILYGDVPLLSLNSIDGLLQHVSAESMGLLTVQLADPMGYGRIVRDSSGQVLKIVEQKDDLEAAITINHAELEEAGHWGVPTLVFDEEPFFGQDRIDMAVWRMKQNGLKER